jgi:hypothetical protein
MRIVISKEDIEKQIGYEIENFNLEPLYANGKCIGLNVMVQPKCKVEFITMDFTILPSSENLS